MKRVLCLSLAAAIAMSMPIAFAEEENAAYYGGYDISVDDSVYEEETDIGSWSETDGWEIDDNTDEAQTDGYALSDEEGLELGAYDGYGITDIEGDYDDTSGSIADGYTIEEDADGIMSYDDMYAYSSSNVPAYLFDANYYAAKYDDLRAAFGTNKTKLYNHWNTYGKSEGRSPSPVYDPDYYMNNNGDLKAAFGRNYSALYNHFVTYGINEFRKSSPLYDGGYYKTHYSDLQNAFGNNSVSYLSHFLNYGMKEGRQASDDFNVHDYKSRYGDLQNAFGNNLKSYYYHYMEYGVNEGRNAKPSGNNSPAAVPDTTQNAPTESGRNAWVKTSGSNLNMRASNTQNSDRVCSIPNGSQITVYGNPSNNFYKATYGNYSGYVSADYITFSQPNSGGGSGLVASNLSRVSLIKQGSKTCKATAVAQSLNLIVGSNRYSTSGMGNANCKSIQGNTYHGSDGVTYKATYKTDTYRGSASEQMSQINKAISSGLPIVVAVHKTSSGTKHHWVTVIGKSGSTYEIIDPATGSRRTMANAGYAFGLTNTGSSGYFYGYVSFSR